MKRQDIGATIYLKNDCDLSCREAVIVNLNDGVVNHIYRVVTVDDLALPVERRLEALGLTEGTELQVLQNKTHGAVIVKVRGTRFAVGQTIAAGIGIEEVAVE